MLMDNISRNIYGNPSSTHSIGIMAEEAIDKARRRIAVSLGTDDKEVIFTSGATEANNMAIRGCLANRHKSAGREIITTAVEHPSVLNVFYELAKEGYKIRILDVDKQGFIDPDKLAEYISDETALISILLVNNETGTIQDAAAIAEARAIRKSRAILHFDAVQGYCKIFIPVGEGKADLVSVSSHKIHGPKGAGALYVKNGIRLAPAMAGGGQEFGLRPGTENVPAICGFGLAAEIGMESIGINMRRVADIRKIFIEYLDERINGFTVNSPESVYDQNPDSLLCRAIPHIVNVSFKGVKAEVLLNHLSQKEIYISAGAACSSRHKRASHVLTAMKLSPEDILGAVRFSFSHLNSAEEAIHAVRELEILLPSITEKKRYTFRQEDSDANRR